LQVAFAVADAVRTKENGIGVKIQRAKNIHIKLK
jgi:hypothetical protein